MTQPVTTPGTDIFMDASSRPASGVTEPGLVPQSLDQTATAPGASTSRNVFDEFDDFNDLSEAQEADNTRTSGAGDFDFNFGRQSQDEWNPAFDSPAAGSQNATPMARTVQPVQPESNGFANFTPNVSTSSAFGSGSGDGNGSVQHTPQNVQHDWDAIFSGLDSNKDLDTAFSGSGSNAAAAQQDPWSTNTAPPTASTSSAPIGIATTNGNGAAAAKDASLTPTPTSAYPPPPGPPPSSVAKKGDLGRAITPGTEHDDPILKRLTGMGYARSDALNALEMYDYDINKVSHLQ